MEDSKTNPLVTVVIPMFNAFPFIKEMLECMENQTYTNWELLVVDDGSTDESIATVEDYSAKDIRIKLLRRPDDRKKGGNTCRNIGLENAKGEYIIWFDADDLIMPYCLEQRVLYILNKEEASCCIFPMLGFITHPFDSADFLYGFKTEKDIIDSFLYNALPFVVVTNIYKRRILVEKGISWDQDLTSHQDAEFNLECLSERLNYEFATDVKVDYLWRMNGNPKSTSKQIYTDRQFNANIYYFNKQIQRFAESDKYKNSLLGLVNYIFKIFIYQNDKTYVTRFLDHDFIKNKKWLRTRLKTVVALHKAIAPDSRIFANMLILLLCPIFDLKYRFRWAEVKKQQKSAIKRYNIRLKDS